MFLGGVTQSTTEQEVRSKLECFGDVTRIKLIPKDMCGFVAFQERSAAEQAMETYHKGLQVMSAQLKPLWAKSQLADRPKKMKRLAGEKRS